MDRLKKMKRELGNVYIKSYALRIDNDLYELIAIDSKKESRSVNQQINYIIKCYYGL